MEKEQSGSNLKHSIYISPPFCPKCKRDARVLNEQIGWFNTLLTTYLCINGHSWTIRKLIQKQWSV